MEHSASIENKNHFHGSCLPAGRSALRAWGINMKRVGMVRVGLYLSESQVKKLKTDSRKKGLTVSEIIRRMIDEGFERSREGKGREA